MGYRGYQGRGGGSSGWLKAVVILLAVLVAAGLVYLVGFSGYVEFHIPQSSPQQSQQPQESQNSATPEGEEESASPQVSPEPEPSPELTGLRGLQVNWTRLIDGTALQRMEEEGADALVVEMKGIDGELAWPSQATLAARLGVNGTDTDLIPAIQALAQEDVYLVAQIECFRDQAMAGANVGGGLLTTASGNPWYDFYGWRWVSPVSQEVTDYIITLCRELAEMGFDEIVLKSSGFPVQGEIFALGQNQWYPEDLTGPVTAFWEELGQALADTDVVLSPCVTEGELTGSNLNTGLNGQTLGTVAQRIWLESGVQNGTAVNQALTAAGLDPSGSVLVTPQTVSGGWTLWISP